MATAKNVTVIPATCNKFTMKPLNSVRKKRVAGYARVSTDRDEQFTSYEAQIDYYTNYIKSHDDWQFVEVYTDEGISGTNTKHREGFNRMIEDALSGKIDLIVTKSVSRFARNTVDSLTTVRKLKDKGVEVFFEKENIYTLDSKGELLITIMSSLAQEESRSISENVTWGKRKQFADGKVSMPYSRFLGYERGTDGTPQINEEEAAVVRRIYDLFLSGKTPRVIARILTEEEIPTPGGKRTWYENTVYSILQNEKYKGSALLQKKFTTDFLTKKQKINEGEVPQYYVEESHPAIIDPQMWELTQIELKRRKDIGVHNSTYSVLSARIVCADCGGFYGPKIWHSNSKYRKEVWRCNHKYENGETCQTPHITDDLIKQKYLEAVNTIFSDRQAALEHCRSLYTELSDSSDLDSEITECLRECEIIAELNRKWVEENASHAMDQEEFISKYNYYVEKYEEESAKVEKLKALRSERLQRAEAVSAFMFELSERDALIEEFNERLWLATIEVVVVHQDGTMNFKFKDGTEVIK